MRIRNGMVGATLACLIGAAEVSAASCGSSVTVRRGDTLSAIAARCDVAEGVILRLNPSIDGSGDLRAGMTLDLGSGESSLEQFKSSAEDVVKTLEGVAKDVGTSVDKLLKDNPDLHQRLLKLGERLGLSGLGPEKPQLSISPEYGAPGASVTLSAIGLPKDIPVTVGGGAPGSAYETLADGRTTPEGTLRMTVRTPAWADASEDFVFTLVNQQQRVIARSDIFDVTSGHRL